MLSALAVSQNYGTSYTMKYSLHQKLATDNSSKLPAPELLKFSYTRDFLYQKIQLQKLC